MIARNTARRDKPISIAVALAIHGAILVGGTFGISPVEYAVEAGSGGIEVHLVAALPAASTGSPALPALVESADGIIFDEAARLLPASDPAQQPLTQDNQEKLTPRVAASDAAHVGDGSSLIPGQDATTFHSTAGAKTLAGPAYFRNPAPAYPALARASGLEGTVLLRAEVTPGGRCGALSVIQSSGHAILDEAAAQAIRRWRFKPARRAGSAIAAWVEIPVRFSLLDSAGK